jgi:hypothetical protein
MKNLYLIPTDKPSRLLKTMPKGNLILSKSITSGSHWENQNIYITSNEEIKEGDVYMRIDTGLLFSSLKGSNPNIIKQYCKKVILTTDQDLIKDGVQAIDDDFLEWFVRNPSCEWVEIKPLLSNNGRALFGYKIIIPKEEPKQETLEEAAKKSFGEIWASLTTEQSEYLKGYIDRQIDMAKRRQAERMYSDIDEAIWLLKQTTEFEVLESFKGKVKELEKYKNR